MIEFAFHPLVQNPPFPLISSDGELKDGFLLPQAEFCKTQCLDRVCRNHGEGLEDGEMRFGSCPDHFSVISGKNGSIVVTVNGVIETVTSGASPAFKKAHKGRKVKKPAVERWLLGMEAGISSFEQSVEEAGRDSIAALHDIKAAITTLLKTAEDWIYSYDGMSLEEKLNNAPDELRTIYQTCQVVVSLLQLTDIIANSEAARYGQPSPLAVYKLGDMLVRVFRARAIQNRLDIQLAGSSFNRPRVYKSFGVIPLVLIDNAVKHAEHGSEIRVTIDDRVRNSVALQVTSVGPIIQKNEEDAIFKRGIRGKNAAVQGSGLGLFVAQEVAIINQCPIHYSSRPLKGDYHAIHKFECLVSDVSV